MRTLRPIAFVAAVVIGDGLSTSSLAADRNITAIAPLERASPGYLDKANGVGPRFKFSSVPQDLSLDCALSVRAHVNEADLVDYPSARTLEEFLSKIVRSVPLSPSEAERASIHTSFALGGEGPISGAMCTNLKAGPEARGHCFGTISASGYTIIYTFDPIVCRHDNVAVARALVARLSVGNRDDREPEPDCATKLEEFTIDIDDLLTKDPRDITDVFAVLDRHFPLHDCTLDEVSRIVKKSRYFRSEGTNGPKRHVFWLNSETAFSRGVSVGFGLTDTGHSSLPFAMWSPPFP
jgi:hypothetical protein